MFNKTSAIRYAFCAALITPFSMPAQAQSIQMLPPVQSGSTTTVCSSSTVGKLLSWDGTNPITCQASVTVDSSGRLGIGTATPTQALDVAGAIRTNMAGVGGVLYGSNPGSGGWPGRELVLTLADGVGNNNDGIWIGPNTSGAAGGLGWVRLHANNIALTGNNVSVGVGTMNAASKLDVNGGVKVGWDASCTAAKAGTMRYNSTTLQMEVCNGASWGSLSSGLTYLASCQTPTSVSGTTSCKCNAGETIMLMSGYAGWGNWGDSVNCTVSNQNTASVSGSAYSAASVRGYCTFACFK